MGGAVGKGGAVGWDGQLGGRGSRAGRGSRVEGAGQFIPLSTCTPLLCNNNC